VVGELGLFGSGPLRIFSSEPLSVNSRTYNLDSQGSFGQFLDGLNPMEGASAGDFRWLPQLQQNAYFRTNIGILNTGSMEARVWLRLFDASGVELATVARTLDSGQRLQLQEPFDRIAGQSDLDAGYATIEVKEGSGVHCYASVIDKQTNDPTTLPALE